MGTRGWATTGSSAHANDQHPVSVAAPINDELRAQARACADEFIEQQGFAVRPDAPVRDELAAVLERMAQFGIADLDRDNPSGEDYDLLGAAAEFCRTLASQEVNLVPDMDRATMVSFGVVGTVLSNAAIAAVHRMALESAAHARYGR